MYDHSQTTEHECSFKNVCVGAHVPSRQTNRQADKQAGSMGQPGQQASYHCWEPVQLYIGAC